MRIDQRLLLDPAGLQEAFRLGMRLGSFELEALCALLIDSGDWLSVFKHADWLLDNGMPQVAARLYCLCAPYVHKRDAEVLEGRVRCRTCGRVFQGHELHCTPPNPLEPFVDCLRALYKKDWFERLRAWVLEKARTSWDLGWHIAWSGVWIPATPSRAFNREGVTPIGREIYPLTQATPVDDEVPRGVVSRRALVDCFPYYYCPPLPEGGQL